MKEYLPHAKLHPSTGLAQFHGTVFGFFAYLQFSQFCLRKIRIWYIKIGIVLVLYFNPWVDVSACGLQVPRGPYSQVANYFGTCLKIQI
jgi:hypothetical protein